MIQTVYQGSLELLNHIMEKEKSSITKADALTYEKILLSMFVFIIGAQRKSFLLTIVIKVFFILFFQFIFQ
jgi:hypothetical protein